jgi:beta-mannosidase
VRRFDSEDWWYRCRFAASAPAADAISVLGFDGLATLADVWLNGSPLLSSDNMFIAHQLRVDHRLQTENELALRFRSLHKSLGTKRPRPRWRAPMIENQQLRWFRTTLLGRTPGWSPPAAAVGPWQPVWLEQRRNVDVGRSVLRAHIDGDRGLVDLDARIELLGDAVVTGAQLFVERGERTFSAALNFDPQSQRLHGRVPVEHPALWWPHTHGEPATYAVKAILTLRRDTEASACEIRFGAVGFRSVSLDTSAGRFQISVNGLQIFCRGACWTPLDVVSLRADPQDYATALQLARDAGMNMIRVGGTMVYESDAFLELCDANGILLWQDFMFANMDYPAEDAAFAQSVAAEVEQQLDRLSAHPCLTVLCGNSEVEQQAAMWGAPRERWHASLFHQILPEIVHRESFGIPYWPSSAHGGEFPHQVDSGTTSYYGVGAYLRPLEDARRSDLKFATECLAFANVPEDGTIATMPSGLSVKVHHPEWKQRSPRDLGAGWDFDDVRDFYLERLFEVDALKLRYANHELYLQLGRIATGEAMAASFAEWRRERSSCRGALVWFMRDLWPGAGWGVIDALGRPKAAYYFLRRALQPIAISISNEGFSGLVLQVVNDRDAPLQATAELTLYREGQIVVAAARRSIRVEPHGSTEIAAAGLFDGFHDLSYAYRFGPPSHDVAVATLRATDESLLSSASHFPVPWAIAARVDLGMTAVAGSNGDGSYRLALRSRRFARAVTVSAEGFSCDDQYFDLIPDRERVLLLEPDSQTKRRMPQGSVQAANASAAVPIESRE